MKIIANVLFNFSRRHSTYHQPLTLSDTEIIKNVTSKVVLISESRNIFKNLAFEDWIYAKSQIENNCSILFLWVDDPCAVIGRHQNPWTELHVDECIDNGIIVSRRNSGGGTVFHDHGNLNLSFITNRSDYNRKLNLSFVASLLRSAYNVNCEISCREDLVTQKDELKVSGTASKLSSKNAYHHCTLLVDSDLNLMRKAIRKEQPGHIDSNATSSIRSSVTNLKALNSDITIDSVIENIATAFSSQIYSINPSDSEENDKSAKSFASWKWVYGRTPKFSIKKQLEGGELEVSVVRGIIDSATITTDGFKKDFKVEKVRYTDDWIEKTCHIFNQ